jgi:surface antigen
VPYARQRSGIEIYGDAYTWWDQAEGRFARVGHPEVGAVMAMWGYRTTTRGHVAFVTAVIDARMILVDHANWLNGGEISVNVPVIDVSPGNDWSQVRVWHIPGSHWGGRIYSVQGFILADPIRVASS